MSTDPAHSLADSFGEVLGPQPTAVTENLWGQELDAQERMEESWAEIQDYLMEIFNWAGLDAIEAEELAVFPGLDEVFSLSDIKTHASSGAYDVLVVDCAPTAETIRFLSLPDILAWYMDRLFPVSRRVNKAVAPVLKRVTSLPVAGDRVFAAGRRFYDRLDGVREILTDPAQTSVRLVVNPERMVIAEARRTYTYLSLFGYRVDAVVANRVLPDDVTDPWFARWKELHAEHLTTIREAFDPLPVLTSRLAQEELVGVERLRAFADHLYGEIDPVAILHEQDPMRVRKKGDGYVLVQELPFADREELDVARRADELLVRVGPYRRAIALPDALRRRDVTSATLRAGRLRVTFGPPRTTEEAT